VIEVDAAGTLKNQLTSSSSGFKFMYQPMCGASACAADGSGGPITGWSCDSTTAKTDITAKYLPAICRG
jgi:hypothetical protein